MIKNKKKLLKGGSFRFSRKKSDTTNGRSKSDGNTSQPTTTDIVSSTKPRSYSPSDYYFHTTAQGGVNAPLTPLSEHYATNETLLSLFSTLYEKDQFSVAYAAGVKFVEVALLQIPHNGYFKSERYRKERTKSAADALRVTKLLGGMVDEMEDDEKVSSSKDFGCSSGFEKIEKLQKLATLAQRSFDEAIDDLNDDRTGSDGGGTTSLHCQDWDVAHQVSLFWKEWGNNGSVENVLSSMPDNCCTLFGGEMGNDVGQDEVQNDNNKTKRAELFLQQRQDSAPVSSEQAGDFEREESQQQDEEQFDVSINQTPQRPTNEGALGKKETHIITTETVSHESNDTEQVETLTDTRDEVKSELRESQVEDLRIDEVDEELKIALSMSLAESISSTISTGDDGTKPEQKTIKVPVSLVAKQYRQKYESLRENGSIHVRFLDTYQGRIADSTNGCTVVAPLMCINYFTSDQTDAMNGIADEMINQVIDVHTVSVLPEVRRKLSLPRDSFIVPSDVHDYLIDTGLLSTSQFVGVCGGSILDDDHIESFKSTLLLLNDERERKRLRGKRLGATFFFAGHVIAFHHINHEGCDHIELIDSLPNHETWKIRQSSSDMSSYYEDRDPSETSCRSSDSNLWERSERFDYHEQNRNAVRVRCLDVRHVDTLIRHYALSKFSDEEKRFCDEHVFQEENSSFDPRVFQAFIWAEA